MLTDKQEKLLRTWNASETPREAFIATYKGCECECVHHCDCIVKAYRGFQAKIARIQKKIIRENPYSWDRIIKVKKTVLRWG